MSKISTTFTCPHCDMKFSVAPLLEGDAKILDDVHQQLFGEEYAGFVLADYLKHLIEAFRKLDRLKEADALGKWSELIEDGEFHFSDEESYSQMSEMGFSLEFIRLWQHYDQTGKIESLIPRVERILNT